jgi:hypothetical protein
LKVLAPSSGYAVLELRVTKTFLLAPAEEKWYVYTPGRQNTDVCRLQGHYPNCIAYTSCWSSAAAGGWRLRSPIDVQREMPGTGHVLEELLLDSMVIRDWCAWPVINLRRVTVYEGDAKVFEALNERISQGDGQWVRNVFRIGASVSGVIDVELNAYTAVMTCCYSQHFANVALKFSYVPSETPSPATVRAYVYDSQTGSPVPFARVSVMSGSTAVGEAITGIDGWAEIRNVPATSEGIQYVLSVVSAGYWPKEVQITVYPGVNEFKVGLERSPAAAAPWWLPYAVGGAVVAVVAYAAWRLRERLRR